MVTLALPCYERASVKALWYSMYDAKGTHKVAYLVIPVLCMGTLPSNEVTQFAKEKTTGTAFVVCKCLQGVKDNNWEEDKPAEQLDQ